VTTSEGAARAARAALSAIRPLHELSAADAGVLGPEACDLAALAAASVPICTGWVIAFEADQDEAAMALEQAFAEPPPRRAPRASQPPAPPPRIVLRVEPWFTSPKIAARSEASWPEQGELTESAQVRARLAALFAQADKVASTAGVGTGGLRVRIVRAEEGAAGRACSVDPSDGDPSTVAVWLPGQKPWRIDRKTMRAIEPGSGTLARSVIERAADLADRAQLALGRPVELGWALSGGRPVVTGVRDASVTFRFTDDAMRKVALLWHDEGPIAPLALDALDKALREESDPVDEPRVRRIFARAYRRVEMGRGRQGESKHSLSDAAVRAARVVADVARPIAAARAFERTVHDRLSAFDRDELSGLDDAELSRALRERQRVVIEAEELLDRARKATGAVIGALEAAVGTVPRECVDGLAAIRRTRSRKRLDERLAKAAKELGEIPDTLDPVPAPLRRRFAELRRELAGQRPLGLDVRPTAYGASDAALVLGMRAAMDGRAERAESAQKDAIRRLMATARARPLGQARAALARTLTVIIEQLADAKGTVAEGLSSANLRFRDVALEIGRRLVERGVLDEPEDALFLYVAEIQEALGGEPGAYTSRVRLRREEDARWREMEPPTRLPARLAPSRPTYTREP
jgi:hypothetical protein